MQTSFILECISICDIRTYRAVNEPPPPEIQLTRKPDPTTFTAVSSPPHSQSISFCPALYMDVCVCVIAARVMLQIGNTSPSVLFEGLGKNQKS